jgi:PIN domain nuclease of toxin-antitoxin system
MEGFLLDTHIWVWLQEGMDGLSPALIHRLNSAVVRRHVFVSAVSIWEIGTLVARGRLQLNSSLETWVGSALNAGMELIPLDAQIAVECTRLPGDIHRDPAGRMLVATARVMGLALVTVDERILAYGKQGHVKVIEK